MVRLTLLSSTMSSTQRLYSRGRPRTFMPGRSQSPSMHTHEVGYQNSNNTATRSPWTLHPFYGLVHPTGCTTCTPYIAHIQNALENRSDMPSFDAAYTELERGRTMNRQPSVDRCRSETKRYKAERDRLLAQVSELQETLNG